GAAHVRVRFWREEVWDLTLDELDSMVGIELMSIGADIASLTQPGLKPQQGEDPFVQVALYVMRGSMSLNTENRTFGDLRGPTGRSLRIWRNKEKGLTGPHSVEAKMPQWELDPPLPRQAHEQEVAKAVALALNDLAQALTKPERRVEVALREFTEDKLVER